MDICAIDPGLRGAAALLRRDLNRHGRLDLTFIDMVDLETEEDGESRRQPDAAFLGALLERWDPDVVVLENVQPAVYGKGDERMSEAATAAAGRGFRKSSMSPSDAFRFGIACGMQRGIIKAYGYDPVLVHPRTWTLALGLKGGDKKPHAARIKQLVPSAAQFITLAKHDGRADAGCMAFWYANKTGML